jgi:outer membrane protein assembly factor BamB
MLQRGLPALGLLAFLGPDASPVLRELGQQAAGKKAADARERDVLVCFALSPDDRVVAAGDIKGNIRLWDLATRNEILRFTDPSKSFLSYLVYAPGGKQLVSSHGDGQIRVWDAATGKLLRSLPRAGSGRGVPAFTADGRMVVAEYGTDTVTLWTTLDSDAPIKSKLPAAVQSAVFTPDGTGILVGCSEGPLHVLDAATGKVVRTIGRTDVKAFAVSPDGRTVATSCTDPNTRFVEWTIRFWDLATGEERFQLTVGPSPSYQLRFTPDGNGLLVQNQGNVEVWEVSSGHVRAAFGGTWLMTPSSKGRLVCCGGPNDILVWDLTGRNTGGVLDATPLAPDALEELWGALQSDAGPAYAALWRLAGVPDQTVPFLEEKVRGLQGLDKRRVADLIADLDSAKFAVRQKATDALPKYGRWALYEVKAALQKQQPLEVRLRLEAMLPRLVDYPTSPEQVLAARVVEVLEQCGTPAARRLLEVLAAGDKPQFVEPARAALARSRKV